MKKGLVFTLEAIIAILLLVFLAILITFLGVSPFLQESSYERLHYLAQDSVQLLTKTRVGDVRNVYPISDYIERGIIKEEDMNKTLLDVIGSFWVAGNFSDAKNITEAILNKTIPENLGYSVSMGDYIITSPRDVKLSSLLSVTKLTVSGYSLGKPVEGYMARAFLEKILGKASASYFYFGGFVGQGNLTFFISDIPSDANITAIYIEANLGSNFTLHINNSFCGIFNKTATGDFPVDNFTITDANCLNNIYKGRPTRFDINFTQENLNNSFIGGGYLKVIYDTAEFAPATVETMNYSFPGIVGIPNLYDSFYVPGTLDDDDGMKTYLHYFHNITNETGGVDVFLRIGGVEIYRSNNTGEQAVSLSFDDIWPKFGSKNNLVNYVSNRTVPLRFGAEGFGAYTGVGLTDVVMITDVSGSMEALDVLGNSTNYNTSTRCGLGRERRCWSWYCLNRGYGCTINYPACNVPRDYCREKMDMAREVDRDFVNIVLNVPGNRVGLVNFSTDIRGAVNLTNNTALLINAINSYTPTDATCICCGINRATQMLDTLSDSSKFRGMLVMSDGIANTIRTSCGSCQGAGAIPSTCPAGDRAACQCAILKACQAREKGYTVVAVAFGDEAHEDTLQKIACWNCTSNSWIGQVTLPNGSTADCRAVRYAKSGDYEELKKIYKEFGEYFVGMGYVTQKVNITGEVFSKNILYPDSYIEFKYEPEMPAYGYGEIALKFDTKPFGCNGTLFIPQQLSVDEIKRTSYSSDYWTKDLFINNSAYNWQRVWSINDFGSLYTYLGDPFYIQFPASYIKSNENNTLRLVLGLSPVTESKNCSESDKAIYTARFKPSSAYSEVTPYVEGRNITVYYDKDHDGVQDGSIVVSIGKDLPRFNSTVGVVEDLNITYNAVDQAFLRLLNELNFVPGALDWASLKALPPQQWPGTKSNPIDIQITPEIAFDTLYVPKVPSLWGPTNLEIKVWI